MSTTIFSLDVGENIMKKTLMVMVIVLLLVVSIVSFAAAGSSEAQGNCPPGEWHLHMVSEHNDMGQGDHHHVGNDSDLNGDGWICGKHTGLNGKVHVHIDNNIPN
jgi:hypothetical protein